MKRFIILLAVASLALSACQSGKSVGTPLCKKGQKSTPEKPCVALGEQQPTPTPTSSRPRASRPPTTASSKPAAPPPPSCATYKGRTYKVVIEDNFKKYQPENLNVLRGDYILFINKDPQYEHSFTVDDTNLDSGILKPGQQKKMRVMLPPKFYPRWHDKNISYVDGGPLNVNANPNCP